MTPLVKIILIYFAIISLIASIITILDKIFAKRDMWRISEKVLLILGLLGGALAEYITMRLIRHKTLHKKFMIGLPCIIILHIAVISGIIYLNNR